MVNARFSAASRRAAVSSSEYISSFGAFFMDEANISKSVQDRFFGKYFLALGEFNTAYTGIEHHFTCCIKNTLSRQMRDDKNEWLINAVVGSMRMAAAKDTIKRILRVQSAPPSRRALVDKAFAHLGEIEWFRNRLAHNATLLRGTSVGCATKCRYIWPLPIAPLPIAPRQNASGQRPQACLTM